MDILHYVTSTGKDVFGQWMDRMEGSEPRAWARIAVRVDRLAHGNFGNCRALQSGVWELKVDYGPGYRIYYGMIGRSCILLLCGGDKRRQSADINRAVQYWVDFKKRSKS